MSLLKKFLGSVQVKGVEVRPKDGAPLGTKLTAQDLEVVTGGDGSKLVKSDGPVAWSLPFPPPPGPINPWVLRGPSPPPPSTPQPPTPGV